MKIIGFQKTTLLDFPGKVAATIFTPGCNFRCPYCQNGDILVPGEDIEPFTEEEVLTTLEKRKGVLDGVCITGGECTLQKDLPVFIRKVRALGLLVKLDTNGTNPSMLKSLLEENLIDYVAIDIKQCKEKYNTIACMNNFKLEDIEESVSMLINGNIDYEFRTTVANNLMSTEDFEKIGQWIKGAKAYYLQQYKESAFVLDKSCTMPSKDTLESYVNLLSEYVPTFIRGVD